MTNIIEVVNAIGEEVDSAIEENKGEEFFKDSILLYSLIENLLKYLVSTKDCWIDSCKQVDEQEIGDNYDVNFNEIRNKAKRLSFNNAINRAFSIELIDKGLRDELHEIRNERNDFIHDLWMYQRRNDSDSMKTLLEKLKEIVMKLINLFEDLIFKEIGVDIPEIFETLT